MRESDLPVMVAGNKHLIACNGPWLVVQLREHCITSFARDWADYRNGFGSMETDLWLGLEAMHQITTKQPHKIRIHMIADNGTAYVAEYSSFKLESEADNYRLRVSGHSGNASNDLQHRNEKRINDGQPFTTRDRDNDADDRKNCAEKLSGWWHNACSAVHLNTPCENQTGYKCPYSCMLWKSITTKIGPPLKYTRMEIMPIPPTPK